jgi:DHA1 family multidrug resistance protein-like MFS transporter
MSLKGLSRKDLATILCCAVVNLSTSYSVSVAFPIIPLYANKQQIDDVYAGAILGATSFAYLVASPIVGFALIRWKCKTLMVWGLLLIALGDLIFAMFPIPWILVMARVVTGVGNALAEVSISPI